MRVTDLSVGSVFVVDSVDGDAARIDKLAALGLLPGVEARLEQLRPVVVLACDETVIALERRLAEALSISFAERGT